MATKSPKMWLLAKCLVVEQGMIDVVGSFGNMWIGETWRKKTVAGSGEA